ncbi:copper amine oxidase [Sphingobacterium psychroaquaticum]|uniref:copper amine oxidase n=1 Tax=Sphingobacterium psychroaquaticum TaxID=561061 RepID=UPI00106A750E|nr:copper amine oxidase [Sphingobacterium psychroaquaticum]QBQ42766.1 copper amine oxidase [Sphingobacterium psychroaquaticum]
MIKNVIKAALLCAVMGYTQESMAQSVANYANTQIQQIIKQGKIGSIIKLDGFLRTDFPKIGFTQRVMPGPQFIISDDPEYIRVPEAIALQEDVVPGAVRLYVYNVNGVKEPQKITRKITAVIKNTGKEVMSIRMLKYSSQKPSTNYFEIGKKGLEDYFSSIVQNDVRKVQPGEVIAIDEQLEKNVVGYDELVHGFYEFVVDQPAQISVLQTAPENSGPKAFANIKNIIPHSHGNAGRGLFGVSNYAVASKDTLDTKNGISQLIIADGNDDPWITGTIGADKAYARNAGNYGVLYNTKIKWKSTDGKGLALITWNSRSADNQWCGGMGLTMELFDNKGNKVVRQLPNNALITKAAPEAILVEIYKPDPTKAVQEIDFTYSPPGASCLPTPLILVPVDLK